MCRLRDCFVGRSLSSGRPTAGPGGPPRNDRNRSFSSLPDPNCDMCLFLDIVIISYHIRPVLLIRGRRREAFRWRSGMRRPRLWFATTVPGGHRSPSVPTTGDCPLRAGLGRMNAAKAAGSGGEELAVRVQEARSEGPKSPRWSAGRRHALRHSRACPPKPERAEAGTERRCADWRSIPRTFGPRERRPRESGTR
jgi:hypothetical protein